MNEQGQPETKEADARGDPSTKRGEKEKHRRRPHGDVKPSAGLTPTEGDGEKKASHAGAEGVQVDQGQQQDENMDFEFEEKRRE